MTTIFCCSFVVVGRCVVAVVVASNDDFVFVVGYKILPSPAAAAADTEDDDEDAPATATMGKK